MASCAIICPEIEIAPPGGGTRDKGGSAMKTEQGKKTITYQGIIANLVALKDEVEKTSRAEAEAIQDIVANLIDLQATATA